MKVWAVEYEISYDSQWVAALYTNETEARKHAADAPVGKSWFSGGIDSVGVYEMTVHSTYDEFKNNREDA